MAASTQPVRRYSGLALPENAHLPGRHVHATGDLIAPDQTANLCLEPCTQENWQHCEAYLYATDLYNHGYWFEAKSLWWALAETTGTQSELLEALSHAANALLMRRMGWRSAVARSRGACIKLLANMPTNSYMGVDVALWRKQIDRCLRPGGMGFPAIELVNI